jgi:tetratricopeptide (TPR) repeat protein
MEAAFEDATAGESATPPPAGVLAEGEAGAPSATDDAGSVASADSETGVQATAAEEAPAAGESADAVPSAEAPAAEATAAEAQPEASDAAQVAAEARRFDRDDNSYPPVDLDNHFFDRSSHHGDAHEEEEERDPRMALKRTAHVVQRRAQLTKYVKIAVASASVLCLAALVKVAVARSADDRGAQHGSTTVAAAQQAPLPAKTTLPASDPAPAQAAPAAQPAAAAPAQPVETAAVAPAAAPAATDTVAQAAQGGAQPTPPATAAAGDVPANTAAPNAAQAADNAAAGAAPAAAPAAEPDPKAAAKEKNTCRIALERGKLADAIEAGEKSVALDPTDAEAWLILGAAYQEKGNMKDARRCYHACITEGKRGPKYECMAMPH